MNLDDSINNQSKKNPIYDMNPKDLILKGLLDSETVSKYCRDLDINILMNIADEVWMDVENHARKYYGVADTVAAIIFDTNGGNFLTIDNDVFNDEDDEDDY